MLQGQSDPLNNSLWPENPKAYSNPCHVLGEGSPIVDIRFARKFEWAEISPDDTKLRA